MQGLIDERARAWKYMYLDWYDEVQFTALTQLHATFDTYQKELLLVITATP